MLQQTNSAAPSARQKIKCFRITQLHPTDRSLYQKSPNSPLHEVIWLVTIFKEHPPSSCREASPEPFSTGTYMRKTVKWKRCRSPLKVMKDCGGKLLVVISQYGRSYSPGGHSHLKPPISRFTQVPPFLHTPGAQRPERAFTSQYSPARREADVREGDTLPQQQAVTLSHPSVSAKG